MAKQNKQTKNKKGAPRKKQFSDQKRRNSC